MDPLLLIAIVVGVVILLVLVLLVVRIQQRRRRLRERFGSEYERAAQDSTKLAADRELEERERRHEQLDIRPLSPAAKQHYSENWANIQQQFVDRPTTAVVEADRVLTSLMAERGYPTQGFEQQLADLSVEHSRTLEHYRSAHGIMQRQQHGDASTEDLRAAMLHYRTLFEELLGDDGPRDRSGVQTNATARQEPPTEPVPAQPARGTPPKPPPQPSPPQTPQTPQQPPAMPPRAAPPGQ